MHVTLPYIYIKCLIMDTSIFAQAISNSTHVYMQSEGPHAGSRTRLRGKMGHEITSLGTCTCTWRKLQLYDSIIKLGIYVNKEYN